MGDGTIDSDPNRSEIVKIKTLRNQTLDELVKSEKAYLGDLKLLSQKMQFVIDSTTDDKNKITVEQRKLITDMLNKVNLIIQLQEHLLRSFEGLKSAIEKDDLKLANSCRRDIENLFLGGKNLPQKYKIETTHGVRHHHSEYTKLFNEFNSDESILKVISSISKDAKLKNNSLSSIFKTPCEHFSKYLMFSNALSEVQRNLSSKENLAKNDLGGNIFTSLNEIIKAQSALIDNITANTATQTAPPPLSQPTQKDVIELRSTAEQFSKDMFTLSGKKKHDAKGETEKGFWDTVFKDTEKTSVLKLGDDNLFYCGEKKEITSTNSTLTVTLENPTLENMASAAAVIKKIADTTKPAILYFEFPHDMDNTPQSTPITIHLNNSLTPELKAQITGKMNSLFNALQLKTITKPNADTQPDLSGQEKTPSAIKPDPASAVESVTTERKRSDTSFGNSFEKSHCKKLAEELKQAHIQMLVKINPREFDDQGWEKKTKDKTSPNLVAMITAGNSFSLKVRDDILLAPSKKEQKKRFEFYTTLMNECIKAGNFDAGQNIYSGLTCADVYRLNIPKSLDFITKRTYNKCDSIFKITGSERIELHQAQQKMRKKGISVIPFIGHITGASFMNYEKFKKHNKDSILKSAQDGLMELFEKDKLRAKKDMKEHALLDTTFWFTGLRMTDEQSNKVSIAIKKKGENSVPWENTANVDEVRNEIQNNLVTPVKVIEKTDKVFKLPDTTKNPVTEIEIIPQIEPTKMEQTAILKNSVAAEVVASENSRKTVYNLMPTLPPSPQVNTANELDIEKATTSPQVNTSNESDKKKQPPQQQDIVSQLSAAKTILMQSPDPKSDYNEWVVGTYHKDRVAQFRNKLLDLLDKISQENVKENDATLSFLNAIRSMDKNPKLLNDILIRQEYTEVKTHLLENIDFFKKVDEDFKKASEEKNSKPSILTSFKSFKQSLQQSFTNTKDTTLKQEQGNDDIHSKMKKPH